MKLASVLLLLPRHLQRHPATSPCPAEYMNLYELFHARASMHRQVYTHK